MLIDPDPNSKYRNEDQILFDLDLCDDNYAILPLEENVYRFYKLRGSFNLSQITLILTIK